MDEKGFSTSDSIEMELKTKNPFLETSIKMYKANRNDDIAVYMVFLALATEQVFLPMNEEGNLMSLSIDGNMDILPIFSRIENMGDGEPVKLQPCYITDCLDRLLRAKKNLIINPFSEDNIQFLIPYEALEKMLIPVINQNVNNIESNSKERC